MRRALLVMLALIPSVVSAKLELVTISYVEKNLYVSDTGWYFETYNCFEKVTSEEVVNISNETLLFESRVSCDIRKPYRRKK